MLDRTNLFDWANGVSDRPLKTIAKLYLPSQKNRQDKVLSDMLLKAREAITQPSHRNHGETLTGLDNVETLQVNNEKILRKRNNVTGSSPDYLVILLHGRGFNISGAKRILGNRYASKLSYDIIAPVGPEGAAWTWPGDMRPDDPATATLDAILKYARENGVPPERRLLLGQSFGAMCALQFFANYSSEFRRCAAVMPFCSTREIDLLTDRQEDLWIAHGAEDPTVPVEFSRRIADQLPKCRYTEIPYIGHTAILPFFSMREVWHWMFE